MHKLPLKSGGQKMLKWPNIWIRDTSVTQHPTNNLSGGENQWKNDVQTKGHTGEKKITAAIIGFTVYLFRQDGNE